MATLLETTPDDPHFPGLCAVFAAAQRDARLVAHGLSCETSAVANASQERQGGAVQRTVVVEVLLLGAADGLVTWTCRQAPLGSVDPDTAARELAGPELGAVSHSTSWRQDDAGAIVLTYAVTRPRGDREGEPLLAPSVVCGSTPLTPTPDVLHAHHVVAHAVRHLVDLLDRDPVVAAALVDDPDLVAALRGAAAGMPVAPHDEAHRAASRGWAGARPGCTLPT